MNNFKIFKDGWVGDDTVCGWGSRMENTLNIRQDLPDICRSIQRGDCVKLNDAGCGDLWWWKNLNIPLVDYVGYDMFPKSSWDELPYDTRQLNLCEQDMRSCDIILCRDVFIHWPNEFILQALERFRKVGTWLYSTSYTGEYFEFDNNDHITDFSMHHSKLNLCSPPFDLGIPRAFTAENYENGHSRKVMCLWKLK